MKTVTVKKIEFGDGLPKVALPIVSAKKDYRALTEKACPDLLEFRADSFIEMYGQDKMFDELSRLCEQVPGLPILFTFRTQKEGGAAALDDDSYRKLLEEIMKGHRADFVDIELSSPSFRPLIDAAHANRMPVVASNHDFRKTPEAEEILLRLKEMEKAGADIVKGAFMPSGDADVRNCVRASLLACEDIDVPHLVISMGKRGGFSRCEAGFLGSAFTFGCLPGEASAPGQMDTEELREILQKRQATLKSHVFLVGFMGTGKTTMARELTCELQCPMVEMDQEIERRAGKRVSAIFAEDGEEHFRDLETDLLFSIASEGPCVVSCGGGAVLRKENRRAMKRLGTVVCLEASPEELYRRLWRESAGRPNLKGRTSVEGIRGLMDKRKPAYDDAADIHIMTDGKSKEEIGREIRTKIHCEQS